MDKWKGFDNFNCPSCELTLFRLGFFLVFSDRGEADFLPLRNSKGVKVLTMSKNVSFQKYIRWDYDAMYEEEITSWFPN